MTTKYSVEIIKHGYAVNKCEFFTVRLHEVPKIKVSRSTREYKTEFTNLGKPATQTFFKGQRYFDIIKNRHEQNLPIFIHGEVVTIHTTFTFTPTKRNEDGQVRPMTAQTFDFETGKYQRKPLEINTIHTFIDERNIMFKEIIIEKLIKSKEKLKRI
jgi:hypothetical protein